MKEVKVRSLVWPYSIRAGVLMKRGNADRAYRENSM
jgi:hypothetical protein